jgi:hypothetical protein
MQRYFARIIRAFIVSSLGFGGGVFLLTLIGILVMTGRQSSALPVAMNFAIVVGLAFGIFLAAVMLLTDLSARLSYAHGTVTDEIWELEQTRQVEFSGSIKDAWKLSRQALLAVPAVKAVSDDDSSNVINGAVGASWKSPGERMQIDLVATGENSWVIKCKSSCLQSNIAFDYGKNFDNVEAWQKTMKKLIGQGEAGQVSAPSLGDSGQQAQS